jgi:hypothetical protein
LRHKYAGPRLSIEFRTAEIASEAGISLKSANIGVISHNGTSGVICELSPDVTHASVLSLLHLHTEDIISLQESETPLHAILANVYRDRTEGGE